MERQYTNAAVVLALLAGVLFPCPSRAASPMVYPLDQRFATIEFRTGGIGKIRTNGYFTRFSGHLGLDLGYPRNSTISVAVDDSAIDMGWSEGAKLLRSKAFFNAVQFPIIVFRSTSVVPQSPGRFMIHGILTIRGIGHAETFDAVLTRPAHQSPADGVVEDFVATGHVSRSDFGMTADKTFISDIISLIIHVRVRLVDKIRRKSPSDLSTSH